MNDHLPHDVFSIFHTLENIFDIASHIWLMISKYVESRIGYEQITLPWY